jgi:hypothetical protein
MRRHHELPLSLPNNLCIWEQWPPVVQSACFCVRVQRTRGIYTNTDLDKCFLPPCYEVSHIGWLISCMHRKFTGNNTHENHCTAAKGRRIISSLQTYLDCYTILYWSAEVPCSNVLLENDYNKFDLTLSSQ